MAEVSRVGGLEIAHDLDYEARSLRWRRLFAAVWASIIVAALLGLFGAGPLSDARAVEGALQVEYERFTRFGTTSELSVAPGGGQGVTNIAISRPYLHDLVIDDIHLNPRARRSCPTASSTRSTCSGRRTSGSL